MQARKGVLAWTGAAAAIVLLALILFWSDLTGKADPTTTATPSGSGSASETTSSESPTATPTPDAKTQAVAEAKARYRSAMAAVDRAAHDPRKIDTPALVAAGNADPWLAAVINDLVLNRDNGYYTVGSFRVVSMREVSVTSTGEQPTIRLDVCGDTSTRQDILRATGKPAPKAPGNVDTPRFTAEVVKAAVPGVNAGRSAWFVKTNKVVGKC